MGLGARVSDTISDSIFQNPTLSFLWCRGQKRKSCWRTFDERIACEFCAKMGKVFRSFSVEGLQNIGSLKTKSSRRKDASVDTSSVEGHLLTVIRMWLKKVPVLYPWKTFFLVSDQIEEYVDMLVKEVCVKICVWLKCLQGEGKGLPDRGGVFQFLGVLCSPILLTRNRDPEWLFSIPTLV